MLPRSQDALHDRMKAFEEQGGSRLFLGPTLGCQKGLGRGLQSLEFIGFPKS